MKKFFKKTEGFTLVELIVVIAILGILAGVGTVGYSGYIKKANMAADQQLVSQIKNALELQYYADPTKATSDYIVLKVNDDGKARVEDGFADNAMKAAFGTEWEKSTQLKYDGWQFSNVLPTKEDAAKVAKSSYYLNSTPAQLVTSFTGLTDALAGMAKTASQDPLVTMKGLVMSEAECEAMRTQLNTLGVSWKDGEGADNTAYTTAVANLLVQNVATEIGTNQYGDDYDEHASDLAALAITYSFIYGWASTDAEGATILADMTAKITDRNANSADVVNAVYDAFDAVGNKEGFGTYMEGGQYSNDLSALTPIMGTVSRWSDGADMTASGLYSSGPITNAVNNYIAAVSVMDGMTDDEIAALEGVLDDGVVVFASSSGKVGCNISFD